MSTSGIVSDVLCVGLIVADHVSAPIDRLPVSGGLVMTDRLELTIGGCAANVATDLAKLGVRAGIVGRVGQDPLGAFVRERLEQTGVDCRHVSTSSSAQTSATLIVNVKGEDRRFIHALGANAELTGLGIPDDVWKTVRVAYVGGFGLNAALSGENVRQMFQAVHAGGGTTILDVVVGDPAIVPPMLQVALRETDFFLPNRDEGELLTGEKDPWKQAEIFLSMGAGTVVVTSGAEGSILLDQSGRRESFPPFRVEQVDGTGGGDAFAAGLIYGLLKGQELDVCVTYGAAMGASCVRAQGATTGVFNERELLDFVSTHTAGS